VRIDIDLPESLHDTLLHRAEQSGTSIQSLIIKALENVYREKKGKYVTGPMISHRGERGPAYPVDENPHDFVF
jgi:hypothetical protein